MTPITMNETTAAGASAMAAAEVDMMMVEQCDRVGTTVTGTTTTTTSTVVVAVIGAPVITAVTE